MEKQYLLQSADINLIVDIKSLIEQSKQQIAVAVNSTMSILYWQIGKRIVKELQNKDRSEIYGKELVANLCKNLSKEYGNTFSEKNIRRMMQFFNTFPEEKIVVSLIRKLSWTHILAVIPIEDELKRNFYIEMCNLEHWSVRALRERIDSMLYERTALSKKPEQTIKNDLALLRDEKKFTPELVFRDPYFLDFLGLKDTYSEKDLENAILAELQRFIAELGTDFAFLARQKRITIGKEDYYIDLLFYHRGLRRLIAIELKLEDFKIGHKAQMELYLRWLDKHDRREGENEPLGIILCAGKEQELVELLELGKSGIHVAEYFTELPPRELLEKKLLNAVQIARQRLTENAEIKKI